METVASEQTTRIKRFICYQGDRQQKTATHVRDLSGKFKQRETQTRGNDEKKKI